MIEVNYKPLIEENDLIFAKVRPNAIIPTKDEENMGRDIYACFDEEYMIIPPHTTKLIPTGIACAMTSSYGIRLRDRGSNGSKGIHVNAGSVDSGYRGEIFVAWDNTNNKQVLLSKYTEEQLIKKLFGGQDMLDGDEYGVEVDDSFMLILDSTHTKISNTIIYPYTKAIAQAEVVIVPQMKDKEISYEDLQKIPSKRGVGALGSSGK